MADILPSIRSPADVRRLSIDEVERLAVEMRRALTEVAASRTAHFASNLGVVELCLALHRVFDFSRDRLIWDTGHQIYPHKLITGRYPQFGTIRTRGGLMGYPNPEESPYDLFMTGHAGCSVSTALGLASGDGLLGEDDRRSVAVIGDGALPSGIVFEALNNAGFLKKRLLVILNDNRMSICPRVGALAEYLDIIRTNPWYRGIKQQAGEIIKGVPMVGEQVERMLSGVKDSIKTSLHGGALFEAMGVRYFGPVEGHSLLSLIRYLELVRDEQGPILLHVLTEKGHGFKPAEDDPVFFHTPAPFECDDEDGVVTIKKSSAKAYTDIASAAIAAAMRQNPRVTVLTAAMCQGNKLEKVRTEFPDRFFDVGICESHAVAFAAGQAKAGCRPIVDIYSTFLQRSYDQIFQEVCLQNLPVAFMLDRAGLTGPDGPTHHGAFDLGYLRLFPNMVVMAPGDEHDLTAMLDWAITHDGPTAIRYPKAAVERQGGERPPIELGRAEVLAEGADGLVIACGTLLSEAARAVAALREEGLELTLVNARFVKPLDATLLLERIEASAWTLTVEENALPTGFGSALLELVADAGLAAGPITRLGLPDRFVEHGERGELLAELGLDAAGIAAACRRLAGRAAPPAATISHAAADR
ncbi:MAG: 1-deoxy-D-xylulose-5-phosphate synthase [Planctomycetes bacterium]|nr:1-deoxy-D-xylulose-5-phosphate synthase [Planctomycetota bacterium]MBM4057272.1 1-deoxy-D-xylulose-5-phosphate synthase [Planctomycetota bacterium]